MKCRLLRFLLFISAIAWGVSVVGVFLPWSLLDAAFQGMGARETPWDPMMDYWLRMTAGVFTGVGVFFFILAISPRRFSNVIGPAGILMFVEGLVLLVNGLRLGLQPFPFCADTAFCLVAGAGIWLLRHDTAAAANGREKARIP